MIETLRREKYLTERLLPNMVTDRELYDKRAFYTFLSEIPADFMTFVTSRTKSDRVRKHLAEIYGRRPNVSEVDIVTRRLVNLASVATHSRAELENRPLQSQYKNDNWRRLVRCQVCGLTFSGSGSATVDHVLPLTLGGEDRESNWQLLCRLCNDQKGHHFGCCDIARSSLMRSPDFFNQSITEQLQMLSAPKVALRYEVFELAGRRCLDCKRPSTAVKLLIFICSDHRMVRVDNLQVTCEKCVNKKNIQKKYQLR
jgi:5-methylcytosine-specific restriction endonuclease McrA